MVKKYKDLHEIEKQQYEENLQKYQEDHADEVEIINLHNVSFSSVFSRKQLNFDRKKVQSVHVPDLGESLVGINVSKARIEPL